MHLRKDPRVSGFSQLRPHIYRFSTDWDLALGAILTRSALPMNRSVIYRTGGEYAPLQASDYQKE